MGRMLEFVCLSVCLSVCPEHNSKTKDPKVSRHGIRNDLWISYKWYWYDFGVERTKVKVGLGLGLTVIRRGFQLLSFGALTLLVWSSDP